MVLDASLFNIQHYKIWIKGKWSNQSKEAVPSPGVAIEKEAFRSPSTTVSQLINHLFAHI